MNLVGLFGGTFDPPHAGHLAVARAARDVLGLLELEVVPCNVPPHRRVPQASAAQRLAMLEILLDGEPRLCASGREIARGGVSYTIDTLREMERDLARDGGRDLARDGGRDLARDPARDPAGGPAGDRAAAEIVLVLGADSYDELPAWRESERIVALAHLAVLPRPGSAGLDRLRPADAPRLCAPGTRPPGTRPPGATRGATLGETGRAVWRIPMPPVPLAAREIRALLAAGRDPGPALAPGVFDYIRAHGLYGWPPDAA